MPASGAPPTIGETPTTGPGPAGDGIPHAGHRQDRPDRDHGVRRTQEHDVGTGDRVEDAGGGRSLVRCLRTGSPSPGPRACRFTQYSWKWRSSGSPAASITSILVVTGSSDIGSTRTVTPNSGRRARAVARTACGPRQRARGAEQMGGKVAGRPGRTRRPRRSKARSSSVARNVSPPVPSRVRGRSVGQPVETESRSGETYRPWITMSSPVFTMTVRSARRDHARSTPRRNFPAPTPPASATTFIAA